MNDQDRDLILALAAGTLSAADAEVARARIAADPSLAHELSVQQAVSRELSSVAPVAMSTEERSELHSNLIAALNLETATTPAPVRTSRSIAWWKPMFGVAAAAMFVTAVIVLPGTLSSDDSAADAALGTAPTTVAGAEFSPTDGTAEAGDAGASEEAAPGTTTEVLTFSETDGADLLAATEGKSTPESINEALAEEMPVSRSVLDLTTAEACIENLDSALAPGTKVVLGVEERNGDLLVFLGIDDGSGVESVATVNLTSCSLVDVDS